MSSAEKNVLYTMLQNLLLYFYILILLKNQSDFYYLYTLHLYLTHLNEIGYF